MQVRLLYAGGCKNAWVTLGIGRQASKRDKKKAIVARENNLQMFVNNIERYWRTQHNPTKENTVELWKVLDMEE